LAGSSCPVCHRPDCGYWQLRQNETWHPAPNTTTSGPSIEGICDCGLDRGQCSTDVLETVAWLNTAHRVEMSKLHALVIRYREFIEDNGLTPPDDTGHEALTRFRHVFEKAGHLDELQHPELLADWWVKKAAT